MTGRVVLPRWIVVTLKREHWFTRWWLEFRILVKRAKGGKPAILYRAQNWPHDAYGIRNSSAIGKAWHDAHLTIAFRPMRGFRNSSLKGLCPEELQQIQLHTRAIASILGYDTLLVRSEENLFKDIDQGYQYPDD